MCILRTLRTLRVNDGPAAAREQESLREREKTRQVPVTWRQLRTRIYRARRTIEIRQAHIDRLFLRALLHLARDDLLDDEVARLQEDHLQKKRRGKLDGGECRKGQMWIGESPILQKKTRRRCNATRVLWRSGKYGSTMRFDSAYV